MNLSVPGKCISTPLPVRNFLRNRQTFDAGGYLSETPCVRLAVENSPFESARVLILRLLEATPRATAEQMQGLVANSVLQDLLPGETGVCSVTSRKEDLKKIWASADRPAKMLVHQFGNGLREIARFAFFQARSLNCFCDVGMIGLI